VCVCVCVDGWTDRQTDRQTDRYMASDRHAVIAELEAEGVETNLCKQQKGLDSPFTYIIVDESTATRTCIHTPIQEDVQPSEVSFASVLGLF
jgi:hypothetical protein